MADFFFHLSRVKGFPEIIFHFFELHLCGSARKRLKNGYKNLLINLNFFTKITAVKQLKPKCRESCLLKINIPQAHKHEG